MARRKWLDEREQHAWRAYVLMYQLLHESLDRQLQRDSGLAHSHYGILVALSEAPDRSMRMSDLAATQRFSQSRLTHAIARLEKDGYVERRKCTEDRRGQYARLTDKGMAALRAAAPGHVAEVRKLMFDRLTPDQVDALADICETLLPGLDPPVACPGTEATSSA
jgi:DNA-binding MarR family transcriptional regulator